jgi:hypothetical protein
MGHLQVLQPCGPRFRLRRQFRGPRKRTGPSVHFPTSAPHHQGSHHQTSAPGPPGRGPKRFPTAIQWCIHPQSSKHGSDGHALADDDAASPAMHDLQFLPWPGRQRPYPVCAGAGAGVLVLVPHGFMLILDPESCRSEPVAVLASPCTSTPGWSFAGIWNLPLRNSVERGISETRLDAILGLNLKVRVRGRQERLGGASSSSGNGCWSLPSASAR